jgi:hypothetical protein
MRMGHFLFWHGLEMAQTPSTRLFWPTKRTRISACPENLIMLLIATTCGYPRSQTGASAVVFRMQHRRHTVYFRFRMSALAMVCVRVHCSSQHIRTRAVARTKKKVSEHIFYENQNTRSQDANISCVLLDIYTISRKQRA